MVAQVMYVSTFDNSLYRLDVNTCIYDSLTKIQAQISDITFHPNGDLYGISGNGVFYKIDTLSGGVSQIHDFDGQNFNSLTTAGNGLIYTTGFSGFLWSYDIMNSNEVYYGQINFQASGDLTFYNGELYVAVVGDKIARVDFNDLSNSSIIIDQDVPGDIFGIVSYAEDCSNVNTYAITNEDSKIYQIDFTNNTLNFICQLGIEIWGGASSFEFFASDPIVIQVLTKTDPLCNLFNGEIAIAAVGGIGMISYSINGSDFQESGSFINLNEGLYTISIQDENGCIITEEVELNAMNSPEITNISFDNETCNDFNGTITVLASGGTGLLQYSIDGINFQDNNVFDSLQPDLFTITVRDLNNCTDLESVEIVDNGSPNVDLMQLINTTCNQDNGFFQVSVYGGTLPYSFTIDGINFQSSNNFENLPGGEFIVTVQDIKGCQDSLLVKIESSEVPFVESIQATPTTCGEPNGTLIINGIGESGVLNYSINGSGYQKSNFFSDLAPGNYTIYIKDDFGCITTNEVEIEGSDKLIIQEIEINPTDCGESSGSFIVNTIGGNDFKSISVNGESFHSEFSFNNLIPGAYEIQIINEKECSLDTSVLIRQQDCPIYIPNVFSPNEDGINDLFFIFPHKDFVGEFKTLLVVDRWGSVVFGAYDLPAEDIAWDGTYNGKYLESGVYSFYLEYVLEGNIKMVRTGDVTIIK